MDDKDKRSSIKNFTDCLIELLIINGFAIQKYEAYTSNSIYIKVDYGVCGTVRISDHNSHKENLRYLYNVNVCSTEKQKQTKVDGIIRRKYYNGSMLRKLMSDIKKNRDSKIKRFSVNGYDKMIEKNISINRKSKGYWQKAELIWR